MNEYNPADGFPDAEIVVTAVGARSDGTCRFALSADADDEKEALAKLAREVEEELGLRTSSVDVGEWESLSRAAELICVGGWPMRIFEHADTRIRVTVTVVYPAREGETDLSVLPRP